MNDAGYRRWSRTEWWGEGYDRLWTEPCQTSQLPGEETNMQGSLTLASQADRRKIVYLTADSSEELLELNEGETYIIGGICDHNRYKVSAHSCDLCVCITHNSLTGKAITEPLLKQSNRLTNPSCPPPNWPLHLTCHPQGTHRQSGSFPSS